MLLLAREIRVRINGHVCMPNLRASDPRHGEAMSNQSVQSSEDPSPGVSHLVDASSLHTPLRTLPTNVQPVATSSKRNTKCSVSDSRPFRSSTKQKSICLQSICISRKLRFKIMLTLVHICETSSSFLHFLRKTLKSYVGLVPFTDNDCNSIMLDAENYADRSGETRFFSRKNFLLSDSYFEAVRALVSINRITVSV